MRREERDKERRGQKLPHRLVPVTAPSEGNLLCVHLSSPAQTQSKSNQNSDPTVVAPVPYKAEHPHAVPTDDPKGTGKSLLSAETSAATIRASCGVSAVRALLLGNGSDTH